MEAEAKFDKSVAMVPPLTWMLPMRGHKGERLGARGEGEKVFQLMGVRRPWGLWQHNDVFVVGSYVGEKLLSLIWGRSTQWCPQIG